jgi:hypothetical protein
VATTDMVSTGSEMLLIHFVLHRGLTAGAAAAATRVSLLGQHLEPVLGPGVVAVCRVGAAHRV